MSGASTRRRDRTPRASRPLRPRAVPARRSARWSTDPHGCALRSRPCRDRPSDRFRQRCRRPRLRTRSGGRGGALSPGAQCGPVRPPVPATGRGVRCWPACPGGPPRAHEQPGGPAGSPGRLPPVRPASRPRRRIPPGRRRRNGRGSPAPPAQAVRAAALHSRSDVHGPPEPRPRPHRRRRRPLRGGRTCPRRAAPSRPARWRPSRAGPGLPGGSPPSTPRRARGSH